MKLISLAMLLTLLMTTLAHAQTIITQDLSQNDVIGSGVMPMNTVVVTDVAITVSGSVAGVAANPLRKSFIIDNSSASTLLVGYATTMVTGTPTMRIPATSSLLVSGAAVYQGPLSFARIGNSGSLRVTELQR